ncbi:MAG: tetratricopeptide repeat protein [Gomphosphaeria aponina SAG 52.96 = DSM 107014]|uniref:Tetratricopeptide repeat protein n=1 Tax=Gomphosphaeria aponina SAG 52.96 = DSM 107014 TaxID=1521640 RepID=A0A941GQN7_9CHRO|nr:tetratricopeptide repeat protein [Gomphosphaeria aponina SAG 52.96 = DSM 107014]
MDKKRKTWRNSDEEYVNAGNLLRKEGKIEEAKEKYLLALEIDKNNFQSLVQLGGIYEQLKEFEEARKYYERGLKLKPEPSNIQAKVGKVLMEQGNVQQAIIGYQKAIALSAEQPVWVDQGLGDALKKNGQVDEAIAVYEKAIAIKPDNPHFHLNLAKLYFERTDLDNVIKNYQKAIKVKPDLPFNVYQSLGEALKKQGTRTAIKSAPEIKHGQYYSNIWNALNQTNIETLDSDISNYITAYF